MLRAGNHSLSIESERHCILNYILNYFSWILGVPTLDHYEMRANEGEKRGICLIINNIKFDKMSHRTGAEKDEEMLSDFFDKELSFQVEVRRNLDVNTFNNVTTHYGRSVDHSQFDAFVCIIMSHGDHHDSIYCVNGKKVYVADIMEDFNGDNCPSLLYKPKLFFIQACRGSPVKLSANGEHHQRDASYQYDSSLARGLCPQEADFLLAFSTAPGYLSERDPATGTRFIQVNFIRGILYFTSLFYFILRLSLYTFHGITKHG